MDCHNLNVLGKVTLSATVIVNECSHKIRISQGTDCVVFDWPVSADSPTDPPQPQCASPSRALRLHCVRSLEPCNEQLIVRQRRI